jgi:CheY-like chemotaxis protein
MKNSSEFTHPHLKDLKSTPVSRRILLLEDDADLAEVLSHEINKKFFCQVDVTNEPFEAMNKMTENFYDLLIMDWNLPRLNAGETLYELDKLFEREPKIPPEWEMQKVPVVVLSAYNRELCRIAKTRHFNYVGFVTKRKPLDEILASLEKYIR